jgi:hypothetical protein
MEENSRRVCEFGKVMSSLRGDLLLKGVRRQLSSSHYHKFCVRMETAEELEITI